MPVKDTEFAGPQFCDNCGERCWRRVYVMNHISGAYKKYCHACMEELFGHDISEEDNINEV